jgi:hypothetical protein
VSVDVYTMWVCMYACMYVCGYVCTHARTHARTRAACVRAFRDWLGPALPSADWPVFGVDDEAQMVLSPGLSVEHRWRTAYCF